MEIQKYFGIGWFIIAITIGVSMVFMPDNTRLDGIAILIGMMIWSTVAGAILTFIDFN